KYVDGEPVGVRIVGGDELDVAVHQGGDEREIAGEAVELGDDEFDFVLAAGGQGLLPFGAVRAFSRLGLRMLGDELPGAAIEVDRDGPALGVKAEAGLALLVRRHPVIGDELTEMCGQCCSPRRFAKTAYERIQTLQLGKTEPYRVPLSTEHRRRQ